MLKVHVRKKDGSYSWLVMCAALLCNIITGGFIGAPGLLIVEWLVVFDRSAAVISSLPAVAVLTKALASLLVGGLIGRYGCRLVLMFSSLAACISLIACALTPNFELMVIGFAIFGMCHGIMFAPPVVIIYEYFDRHNALASGLSMCGHSLSSVVLIPLYRYCIDTFGWRGAMLIMAGVALNGCVAGMLFVRNVPKTPSAKTLCKSLRCTGLLSLNYVLFVVASCSVWTLLGMTLILSPSRGVSKGLSEMEASMLLPFIGGASTVSRFAFSWISNQAFTRRITLHTVCLFMVALSIALSCVRPGLFIYNAAMMVAIGLPIGGCLTVMPSILVDILGQEGLARGYGVSSAAIGPVTLLMLPAAGWVYDVTGDFNNSFYLMTAFGVLGGFCSLAVDIRMLMDKEQHIKIEEIDENENEAEGSNTEEKEVDKSDLQSIEGKICNVQNGRGSKEDICRNVLNDSIEENNCRVNMEV